MGGNFHVTDYDGGDLGRGTAPKIVSGTVSPVAVVQAFEFTEEAEYTSDSDEKSVENYADLIIRNKMKVFGGYMDVLSTGSGNWEIDTIVSAAGSAVVVNNAQRFQNGQIVDVYASVGGALIAKAVQILTVNGVTATLNLTATVASLGLAAGQSIQFSQSPNQAGSGVNGIGSYRASTDTGLWNNVPRSSWPGMYIKAGLINVGALTPQTVRELQINTGMLSGEDEADDVLIHCTPNEQAQWENQALPVQRIDLGGEGRANTVDMLAKKGPVSMAGRKIVVNRRGVPGYLDVIRLSNWQRFDARTLGPYSINGDTVFPIYGASGGINASYIMYDGWAGNLAEITPHDSSYMTGIAVQKGTFGR